MCSLPKILCGFLILGLGDLSGTLATAQDDAPRSPWSPPAATTVVGEDVLEPFVPLHPRTREQREWIEAATEFTAARALENQREWSDAIALLKNALEDNPDNTSILRRLSRLSFIMGRTDDAQTYARAVLAEEPGDTETLSQLVSYYDRKNDAAAAEELLQSLLKNPKLDPKSAGFLLIQRDLGFLFAERLNQPEKAAEAFKIVLDALDESSANQLSLSDQRRILGMDEATTYGRFGEVFVEANRLDDAITAFRRGLVYNPDDTVLPRNLADTWLRAGKPEQALESLEPFIKRQPVGREPYELLIKILNALDRGDQILPRLEAAARNDPRNLRLQYLLADRYREAGEADKANELYKTLIATQPDPEGFAAQAQLLAEDRKASDLLDLYVRALEKAETAEAVRPSIEVVANDPELAGQLLDAALKRQEQPEGTLSSDLRRVLAYVASRTEQTAKLIPIERIALQREPDPQGYRVLWIALYRDQQYAEAADLVRVLFEKFPDSRDAETLGMLAQSQALAGDNPAALETANAMLELQPDDVEGMRLKGFLLGRLQRNEEAIELYNRMLEKFGDDDEVARIARSGLSVIYVNMDDFEKGAAELEILYEKDPDDAGINNDLGYLYADQGKNLEKAESMIRKALEDDPENGAYLDSLAWVLFKQGRFEEAREPIEMAVERARTTGLDATLLDHMGDIYFKLKLFDKARAAWKEAEANAASATPVDKRLDEIRRKLKSLDELAPGLGEAAPNP